MKRMFLPLLLSAAASVLVCQSATNQESAKIEKLFDDYFREYIALNPEEGSQFGLPRGSGYDFDRAGLNDVSNAGMKANFDLARRYLNRLEEIDASKITTSESIDAEILAWLLEVQLEGEKLIDHKYYIDHLFGVHGLMMNLMTSYHSVGDLQDANDYLKRLEKIPLRLHQTTERIDAQEEKGIRPPVFIVERVIADMEGFTEPEPAENVLYADFKGKLSSLKDVDSAAIQDLIGKAETIIEESLYPAYDEFVTRLRASAQESDSLAGVWKLPGGDKYYQYTLKLHTTASMAPKEVYHLGLKEVQRLQDQARVLLDSLGVRGDTTFGELMGRYRATWGSPELTDKFFYPEGEERNEMILSDYRSLLDRALARLPEAFAYLPREKVTVQAVPKHREASGLTYYEPASMDGSREATFYINMMQPLAKANMPTLIHHETVPGHHYQIAVQHELTQGRMFKHLYFLSGFGEGWAMYTEDLAAELGWLPDIYSRIAELNSQLFRAVRVVLDAGIHSQKWTKESALQYMQDNLGWNSENEVDRYAVWPGQACSYTVGRLKIQELREKAKQQLGPKFDLKEFHMTVLENGSLPLDLLEEIVDDYIAAGK